MAMDIFFTTTDYIKVAIEREVDRLRDMRPELIRTFRGQDRQERNEGYCVNFLVERCHSDKGKQKSWSGGK